MQQVIKFFFFLSLEVDKDSRFVILQRSVNSFREAPYRQLHHIHNYTPIFVQ